MLRHYFPRGYARRVAGIIEAFSLLHDNGQFRLGFLEQPLSSTMPRAYSDADSPDPFAVSKTAALISCGLHPAPPFAFLFKGRMIFKEPVPLLAHAIAKSDSIVMLAAKVYDYPQPLLRHISALIETTDPGPLSHAEFFRQEKKVKQEHELLYADELEGYLEKQKCLISRLLEEKGIMADWALRAEEAWLLRQEKEMGLSRFELESPPPKGGRMAKLPHSPVQPQIRAV